MKSKSITRFFLPMLAMLVLPCMTVFAQNYSDKALDSLESQLLKHPSDSAGIDLLISVARQHLNRKHLPLALGKLQQAEALALQLNKHHKLPWIYVLMFYCEPKGEAWRLLVKKPWELLPYLPGFPPRAAQETVFLANVMDLYEEHVSALEFLFDVEQKALQMPAHDAILCEIWITRSQVFTSIRDYEQALECGQKALSFAEKAKDPLLRIESVASMAWALSNDKKYREANEQWESLWRDTSAIDPKQTHAEFAGELAMNYMNMKDPAKANFFAREGLRFSRDMRDSLNNLICLAKSQAGLGQYPATESTYAFAYQLMAANPGAASSLKHFFQLNEGLFKMEQGKYQTAIALLEPAIMQFRNDSINVTRDQYYWPGLQALIASYKMLGQPDKALLYQAELLASTKRSLDENAGIRGLQFAARKADEQRRAELAQLADRNSLQRKGLWLMGGFSLLLIMLGGVIWRQSKQLATEKKKSEALLLNMLPNNIADRMKLGEHSIADYFEEATVVFIDMVGFTNFSRSVPPQEVVQLLNKVFSKLDRLTSEYGLEKIKTIGDCYMAVSGIPIKSPSHLKTALRFCLAVLNEIDGKSFQGREVQFKIGVETGPAVAGIIGEKRFLFDLWGDTVNTASRMETNGVPSAIQVTSNVYERMKETYSFEPRGVVDIKGKGNLEVFLLRKPA